MNRFWSPRLSQFIYAPFFPDRSWDDTAFEEFVSVNGFRLKVKVPEIRVFETYLSEGWIRESVDIEVVTGPDRLILAIDIATYLTRSERTVDAVRPNREEVEEVEKALQASTFARIDFSDPAATFRVLMTSPGRLYTEFQKRIARLKLGEDQGHRMERLRAAWYIGRRVLEWDTQQSDEEFDRALGSILSDLKRDSDHARPAGITKELVRTSRFLFSPRGLVDYDREVRKLQRRFRA